MVPTDRLLFRPKGSGSRRSQAKKHERGFTEQDLDFGVQHFGPTVWCRTWAEWQERLWADRPERVFHIQDIDGQATVRGVYELHQVHGVPTSPRDFARLKYYRVERGWVVSVAFALEALGEAAD